MSLHTWCDHGPHKPSSCTTFTLNSHWGRAVTGKKSLVGLRTGSLWSCPTLCDLPIFSVRDGGSLGKNTGGYWPILVAIPF